MKLNVVVVVVVCARNKDLSVQIQQLQEIKDMYQLQTEEGNSGGSALEKQVCHTLFLTFFTPKINLHVCHFVIIFNAVCQMCSPFLNFGLLYQKEK